VAEVMGVSHFASADATVQADPDSHEIVRELTEVCAGINRKNLLESNHDAVHLRDTAMTLFNVGQLDLADRARVEELFWLSCQKILHITREMEYVPEDLEHLERELADIYFLNFSVFQSMPDSWAIRQLFPILPISRHREEPTRRAVLADITCDSDGRVDRFIDLRDVKRVLELHPLRENEPYYIGFFLLGAYQEILGDLHNLFGDTNVVHVDANGDGRARLTHVVPGDQVQEVLSYVEYFPADLLKSLRGKIERAIDEDLLNLDETAEILRRFEAGLSSYTYLIQPDPNAEAAT
jgi:arginine decarboxylase